MTRLLLSAGPTSTSSTRCGSTSRGSRAASSRAPRLRPGSRAPPLRRDRRSPGRDRLGTDRARPTTFAEALAILDRFGLRARVPAPSWARLEAGSRGEVADTPKPGDPVFSGRHQRRDRQQRSGGDGGGRQRAALGFIPCPHADPRGRGARGRARFLAMRARSPERPPVGHRLSDRGRRDDGDRPGPGAGGRCQEFALARGSDLATCTASSCWRREPTAATGPRPRRGRWWIRRRSTDHATQGWTSSARSRRTTSHPFFGALGDLVVTGPTGSNLMDVYLGVIR